MSSSEAPVLAPREFARWAWRQLTSMRTALLLLLLLAVVSVPGSFIPQRGVDAGAVIRYFDEHPKLAPVLDALGMFAVFSSPWFSAVYVLLMVSLLGCIIPRVAVYAKALRARPPKPPRNFERLAQSGSFTTSATPDEVVAAGRRLLRGARVDTASGEGASTLAAEKGYLREAGNLLFHVSITLVLVGVAIGTLGGSRGAVIVTQHEGFSNVLSGYNEFSSGALFNPENLTPFSFMLTDFEAEFELEGEARGTPRHFRAYVDVKDSPGAEVRSETIEVNHPLNIDGTGIFLVGQGYSPRLRITDENGDVVFDDAVPFLPLDGTYLSSGVVKVPDAEPDQLGFEGFFYPTAAEGAGEDQGMTSIFPGAANPLLGLNMFVGDLGIDDGMPQSVYTLDTSAMTQIEIDGEPLRVELAPGQSIDLPGGFTMEFIDLVYWARFQIGSTPVIWLPLLGVSLALLGLLGSLFVRPRRTWLRATAGDGGTVVEVAAIDRVPRDDVADGVDAFVAALRARLGETDSGEQEAP